jgi:hypothetical protein
MLWYEFGCEYIDLKGKREAGKFAKAWQKL